MKVRKIGDFFWAVIESSSEIFVGFGKTFKEAVEMCLTEKFRRNI